MRVYFIGNIGVGKSTIMKSLYENLLKNNAKVELYLEPVEEWSKCLCYKYNNPKNREIDIISNDFILLSLLKQRSKIEFRKDTIYLLERDFDCCKIFRTFDSILAEELSNDMIDYVKNYIEYNDVGEYRILISVENIDKNVERIKKRGRLGEESLNTHLIEELNEKIDNYKYNIKIDNSYDIESKYFNSMICILTEKILKKFQLEVNNIL